MNQIIRETYLLALTRKMDIKLLIVDFPLEGFREFVEKYKTIFFHMTWLEALIEHNIKIWTGVKNGFKVYKL